MSVLPCGCELRGKRCDVALELREEMVKRMELSVRHPCRKHHREPNPHRSCAHCAPRRAYERALHDLRDHVAIGPPEAA